MQQNLKINLKKFIIQLQVRKEIFKFVNKCKLIKYKDKISFEFLFYKKQKVA